MREKKQQRKKDFQTLLTVIMMCACLCSVLILGVAQIALSVNYFSGKAYEDLNYFMQNVNEQFWARMQIAEEIVLDLHHNYSMMEFLQKGKQADEAVKQTAESQLGYCADLFSEANVSGGIPLIQSVALFHPDGTWLETHYYPETLIQQKERIRWLTGCSLDFQQSEELFFYVIREESIFLCTWIYDEQMSRAGICILSISKAALENLFDVVNVYQDSYWQIRGNGKLLLASRKGLHPASLGDMPDADGKEIQVDGRKYLQDIKKGKFFIESRIGVKKNVIYDSIYSILQPFCLILILVLGLAGSIVFVISKRLIRPFREMGEDMKRFSSQRFDARMREFDTREFQELSHLFNEMADEIQTLITQVYEKELLAARARMKYLQSQINPHFMFNILTMVSMKAGLRGDMEIQKLLTAFAGLLQGKIFRQGEVLIPLAEEMELIEFYLYLQRERFAGKIQYEISCPEEYTAYRIPRLTLEPLVENAVSHGLEPKPDQGCVWITVRKQEDQLEILVEDDGVGFDTATVFDAFAAADNSGFFGAATASGASAASGAFTTSGAFTASGASASSNAFTASGASAASGTFTASGASAAFSASSVSNASCTFAADSDSGRSHCRKKQKLEAPAEEQVQETERHTHVSLYNTKQMLQSVYGSRAGIYVESSPGTGTKVRIRIPLEEQCG